MKLHNKQTAAMAVLMIKEALKNAGMDFALGRPDISIYGCILSLKTHLPR